MLPSEISLNDCAMETQAWIFDQLKFGSNPNGLVLVRRGLVFVLFLVPVSQNSIIT